MRLLLQMQDGRISHVRLPETMHVSLNQRGWFLNERKQWPDEAEKLLQWYMRAAPGRTEYFLHRIAVVPDA